MKLSIVMSVQQARFEAATFKGDLKANLKRIADLGYHGVELAIRDPGRVDQKGLLDLVQSSGLSVPAVGTGQAWGEEDLSFTDENEGIRAMAIERIKSHLPFASKAYAILIVGLIRGVPKEENFEQAWSWLIDALQECGRAAAGLGVKIALEPICREETPLINTVEQGLELIEKTGLANIGLLLDSYHMHREERSIADAIRLAKGRIFHFHVADSNRMFPGAGHLDFGQILGTLADIGYAGYISGEFLPEPDAQTAAERAIEHLKSISPAKGAGRGR